MLWLFSFADNPEASAQKYADEDETRKYQCDCTEKPTKTRAVTKQFFFVSS
jgi:predicted SprT family Zn-dependent metalloprotease